jgi:hypothetical protein
MHRIDTANAADTLPAILGAGVKPNSFWRSGDPTTGTAATQGDQDWFNAVQEEIMSVLADGDIEAVKGQVTNVRDAIRAIIAARAAIGVGQCHLQYSSNVALHLVPYEGNALPINGKNYRLPGAGLTIPNTGVRLSGVPGSNLGASADYLLYAMDDGAGNLVPDFWPLAGDHMTDTTAGNIGVEVRNNGGVPDSTRTLIGMVGTNAASQFQDDTSARLVLSWFNPTLKQLAGADTSGATTTATVFTELAAAARVQCLTWGNEALILTAGGRASNSGASGTVGISVGVDGVAAGTAGTGTSPGANLPQSVFGLWFPIPAKGRHVLSPMGIVGSGTGTFNVAIEGALRG